MLISLVTVTMGNRPEQLKRLLESLESQTFRDFEHIVIDQSEHPEFGNALSKARNFGLARASGSVVAFPDDDAWYAPDTLQCVAEMLSDPAMDGVSFRVVDEEGCCSAGGWMSAGRKAMSKSTVWHTGVSCSFFVKRSVVGDVRFDERIGVGSGTRFGSGEETDFLLSMIERGARFLYDGTRCVFHPSIKNSVDLKKGWLYGNGYGAVLRKHRYGLARLVWGVSVQLGRAVQRALLLRFDRCAYHALMAAGRFFGYMSWDGR